MKNLQFKRIDGMLNEIFGTGIISEGMVNKNSNIRKLGFYPIRGYKRQYIIFNKETGIYNLAEQDGYVYDYKFNYYLDEDGNILEIKNLKELKEKLINSLPNIYYFNF